MNCKGQLRHQFWSEYSCLIAMQFKNQEECSSAFETLSGFHWGLHPQQMNVLIWRGNAEELKACKKLLGSYGADESAIDSIKHSIDFGEPFYCEIPCVDRSQGVLL